MGLSPYTPKQKQALRDAYNALDGQFDHVLIVCPYISVKELAQIMDVSTRTVKRMAKLHAVPPTVNGHACLRWSWQDASRLLRAWENANNKPPSAYAP